MMAVDVLQSGGQVCVLCQSHDHRKEECALAPPSAGNNRCPRRYRVMEEVSPFQQTGRLLLVEVPV